MNFLKKFFRILKSLFLLAFLLCIVTFMVNNREVVTLHLTPFPLVIETRMFLVMVVLFLLGMLFALIALSPNLIRNAVNNIKNRRKIKKLENAVEDKKVLALKNKAF